MRNNHLRTSIIILIILLLSAACSRTPSRQQLKTQIEKYESILKVDFNKAPEQHSPNSRDRTLATAYRQYVKYYPNDPSTPSYLYKLAMLEAETFHKYQNCVNLLEKLRKNYPNNKASEKSLFFIGYTYAENLRNYPLAKTTFEQFLKEYPKSQFVPSVKFELKYMGKPVNDIFLENKNLKN